MPLSTIATMAGDRDLLLRVAACAALQGVQDAWIWALARAWLIAATPGLAADYADAEAARMDRPGWDADVLTDRAILDAVRAIMTREQTAADAAEREATIPIVA